MSAHDFSHRTSSGAIRARDEKVGEHIFAILNLLGYEADRAQTLTIHGGERIEIEVRDIKSLDFSTHVHHVGFHHTIQRLAEAEKEQRA